MDYTLMTLVRHSTGLTEVILDNPPVNALSETLISELTAAADEIDADESSRVVVLRSAQPMFMAGADLRMVNEGWPTVADRIARYQHTTNLWENLRCPTIVAINGHALGGGCELAISCDWRVMSRGKGRIGVPEIQRGVIAACGGLNRLARLVGRANAMNLNMRGLMIDADEAFRIGLVSEACDPDKLDERVEALVNELLSLPRLSVEAAKRSITQGIEMSLPDALELEKQEMTNLRETQDAIEGVRSFVEKRVPIYVHA